MGLSLMGIDATYALVQHARRSQSLPGGGEVTKECALVFTSGSERLIFEGSYESIEEKVTFALAGLRTQTSIARALPQPEPLPAAHAADLLARVFATPDTAANVGPHFTCAQVDLLAAALQSSGNTTAAARLLIGHADGPDEGDGDLHCDWPLTTGLDPDPEHPVWAHLQRLTS